jgi:serine/threonine protein kinase
MEYLPYGDLGQYIAGGFTEHEVKQVTRQLLRGLAIMHDLKFTHRDLKPEVSYRALILGVVSRNGCTNQDL